MKRLLLFSVLSIFCLTISAQSYIFTGNGDGTTWHDPNNWNPQEIPGNYFDFVTIPTGMTVTNEGTIVFNLGTITGGGTIINNSSFTFLGQGPSNRALNNISLINNATLISMLANNSNVLSGGSTITNSSTGTIIIDELGITSDSTSDRLINNGGTIRSIGSNNVTMGVVLQNHNGTLNIENGLLYLANGSNNAYNLLQDGTYNVAEGATLWIGDYTLQGTFHGQVDGACGIVSLNAGTTTLSGTLTNDVEGNGFTFFYGTLEGGGTIINNTKFNVTNDGGGLGKVMRNITIMNNGEFNSLESANLTPWNLNDGSQILNAATGTVNIGLSFGGNTGADLLQNNGGTVRATANATLQVNFTNSGLFDYNSHDFSFSNGVQVNNTVDGTFKGTGVLSLDSNIPLINNGIFTSGPGASKTFIYNGYRQDTGARLEIDINGNIAETEYDVVQADNGLPFEMNGTIKVNLGFAPALNDEFRVIFSNNRNLICNLPSNIIAHYDNHDYTFDVICNQKDVTLKVTNIVLGTENFSLGNISMYPNPSNGHFTIDLGREYTDVTVQVLNMLGQVISSEKYASAKTIESEITGSAGIYFVRASTAKEGSNTLRIIKQ